MHACHARHQLASVVHYMCCAACVANHDADTHVPGTAIGRAYVKTKLQSVHQLACCRSAWRMNSVSSPAELRGTTRQSSTAASTRLSMEVMVGDWRVTGSPRALEALPSFRQLQLHEQAKALLTVDERRLFGSTLGCTNTAVS